MVTKLIVFESAMQCMLGKEIVERSQGEPMFTVNGPWGSQPSTEKKLIVNSEQLFRAGFSCFLRQIIFSFFTL